MPGHDPPLLRNLKTLKPSCSVAMTGPIHGSSLGVATGGCVRLWPRGCVVLMKAAGMAAHEPICWHLEGVNLQNMCIAVVWCVCSWGFHNWGLGAAWWGYWGCCLNGSTHVV
mmetsp:Transcript_27917/g.61274  ORF Transcript_27917/g.61274 Transcript_27917/m.61274 type:complete len:112 (-) Transcript_27917:409-744(-)